MSDATTEHFVVRLDPLGRRCEAWSTRRLPFEPKGWLLQFRSELRAALKQLRSSPGTVLSGIYGSPVSEFCDVENVLLYNVGASSFVAAASGGLRLERSFACPTPPVRLEGEALHYVSYALSPASAGFSAWSEGSVLAKWFEVPMPSLAETTKPSAVWYALRRAEIDTYAPLAPGRPYGLRLLLELPSGTPAAPAGLVKPLLDGVISALHRHDGSALAELSRRVATQLHASAEQVAAMLVDESNVILGSRRLLWARAAGVQWNPADDLCLATELLARPGDRLALSGRLVELESAEFGSRIRTREARARLVDSPGEHLPAAVRHTSNTERP